MPYQHLSDGLYLLKRRSQAKPFDHYAVLDVGNRFGLILTDRSQPVVVHQTPPGITTNWLRDTGDWQVVGKAVYETQCIERLRIALRNPSYDFFAHNCEQFARFVTTGTHESTQLRTAAVIAGIAALVYFANSAA
jgi:hypothetical protein